MRSVLPTSEPDRERLITIAALGVAALGLARFADPAHAVDDAWISFRVARSAVETGVLTYDVAQPRVEGMTNLLWTLLSGLWVSLPIDPIGPARMIGGLCHLATVGVLVRLAATLSRRSGGQPLIAAAVTGALLATAGSLAFYAMSGLETALYALLGTCGLAALVHGRTAVAGVLLGLLGATRPEGVLVGAMAVLGYSIVRDRRGALEVAVPFLGLIVALEAFRLAYYGALVPNTYAAKPPDLALGATYVYNGILWGTGGLGLLGTIPALRQSRAAALAGAGCAVLVAGVAWSGGDWMPGERRLTELLLVGATLTGVGAGLAKTRRARALVAVPALAWVAGNGISALEGTDSAWYEHALWADLGRTANASPELNTVALADVGHFGWTFRRSIFDIAGLTDAHIAHLSGARSNKSWDEAYFRARAPDLVLLPCQSEITDPPTGMPWVQVGERDLLTSILDHGGYRYHGELPLSPGHWVLVFPRDGITLDPRAWGPRSPRDLREILADLH